MTGGLVRASFDPYDLWALPLGVRVRCGFYAGRLAAKAAAAAIAAADWAAPVIARRLAGAQPRAYPITVAQAVLCAALRDAPPAGEDARRALDALRRLAGRVDGAADAWAWGLGFPWMSKNGYYAPDVPFVTHTPYVMEALLALADADACRDEAQAMFRGTWAFLERLHVLHDAGDELALSYAPVAEPRAVVNANAYAAFAYALHAVHGDPELRAAAAAKAARLMRWVVRRQRADGTWTYYADEEPGNFIDTFHSGFVLKNLHKAGVLLPALAEDAAAAIARGRRALDEQAVDPQTGLCRRFLARSHRDPYRWDLYDQAEYLGVLVDAGTLDAAEAFRARAEGAFRRGDDWWCRIDVFGRRWGRNFLRWGIMPFHYHAARLDAALRTARSTAPA